MENFVHRSVASALSDRTFESMSMEPRNSDRRGLETNPDDDSILNRVFEQAQEDKETLHRWEEEQDHELGTDTERAVKMAAIRTEILQRARPAIKTSE